MQKLHFHKRIYFYFLELYFSPSILEILRTTRACVLCNNKNAKM